MIAALFRAIVRGMMLGRGTETGVVDLLDLVWSMLESKNQGPCVSFISSAVSVSNKSVWTSWNKGRWMFCLLG